MQVIFAVNPPGTLHGILGLLRCEIHWMEPHRSLPSPCLMIMLFQLATLHPWLSERHVSTDSLTS